MAGDQALVLKFKTDLADAQNKIAQFASRAYLDLNKLASAASNAKTAIDFIGKNAPEITIGAMFAAAAAEAVIALKVFENAVYNAEQALAGLNKIGADAAKAGVGTTFFQGWTQQAKELNLETSDLIAMLDRARAAATETIGENGGTSTSTGADRIRQNVLAGNLSPNALTNYNAADTQEARLRVILDLIDQLQQKGAELAAFDLAKTFFGSSFEMQLRNGVDMIGRMRSALDGLQSAGGERIIPEAEVQRAQQIKAEMDQISDRIAKGWKPVMDDIAALQQEDLNTLLIIKSEYASIIELVGRIWKFVSDIGSEMRSWANSIGNAQVFKDLNSWFDKMGLLDHSAIGPVTAGDNPAAPAITVHRDKSHPLPSLNPSAPKASAASQIDQVETYIKSLEKLAATEKAEAETLGMSNQAKQEAVDLAKAQEAASERGAPLTAKEAEQVKALADAYVAAKDKIDAFNKQQEQVKAQGEFFNNTMEGAVEKLAVGGERLRNVLRDIVKELEQAALKAVLLGQGPLAGLFGTSAGASGGTGLFGALTGAFGAAGGAQGGGLFSLFGKLFSGGFAAGGTIPSGHFGLVGENGPEFINGPAAVTPFGAIDAALSSGGGRLGHSVNMTIDARGAQGNAEIQAMITNGVQAGMSAVHSRIARDIGPMTMNWNNRFG